MTRSKIQDSYLSNLPSKCTIPTNNNTFETTNHNNIGFEDAFGGDPFAEKAGAPQNTDEKYSFSSASNKKDSIVVGGTDNSAAAAFEIDPFASGGFPHNKISVVEDEDG